MTGFLLPFSKRSVLLLALGLVGSMLPLHAQLMQERQASRADTLRGSIGPHRSWWDVERYDIRVRPHFEERSITGRTTIFFRVLSPGRRMQVDLQQPMVVDSITTDLPTPNGTGHIRERPVPFEHDEHVIWVDLPDTAQVGQLASITIHYHGIPRRAPMPPWDGGWIWERDAQGNPWMSVACQGLGASVWYPCKDHQSDKAASAALHVVVPDTLVGVANGRLRGTSRNNDGTTTWHWMVNSPVSTYNLVPYIGRYVHFGGPYASESGTLAIDHWVLEHNEEKARSHFEQVPAVLDCFEHWMGPYPFLRDSYKLVEAPHLGMEHQSAIAYGNRYMNGYLGRDLSDTGHGLAWDFIIVHESGHEWFGNNITTADIADMWVHEGFTQYTEVLMTECLLGTQAAQEYVIGLRDNITNDRPIIGPYGVNQEGSGDMYPKGANLVHLIRHLLQDDSQFRQMLRYMNQRYRHKVVTSAMVEAFMDEHLTMDLRPVFDQYLRTTDVPVLQWYVEDGKLWYRWSNCLPYFEMPVRMGADGREPRSEAAGTAWRALPYAVRRKAVLEVDPNWYVEVQALDKEQRRAIGR